MEATKNIHIEENNAVVTSSNKMAALFASSDDRAGFERIKGLLDEKIEGILVGYVKRKHEEAAKEISANYTKAVLLEFRRKLFNLAVSKAEECNRLCK